MGASSANKRKMAQGAINKRRWGLRTRKLGFFKKQRAALEVAYRRNKIAKGEVVVDDFSWNKQFIPWWDQTRRFIIKRDKRRCRRCLDKQKRKKECQVHHIVPRKFGGDERPSNLISLCDKCHKKTELQLMRSGLFDSSEKWRKLDRKQLLLAAVKASGLKDAILLGPPKD